MKNTRFFLMSILTGLLFVACSNDDDQAVMPGVSISITQDIIGEGDGVVTVSFSTTETFSSDAILTYEVSGTATSGEDFTALPGSLTLAAGERTATQDLIVSDDDAVEQNEEITITLTAVDGGTDFISATNSVTLTITDNDSFAFENGILVLHEGNFFGGNASVSFVAEDLTSVTNGIFNDVNDEALGDVGPERILANENTLYVAHQGGFSQNNIVSAIDATDNSVASITVGDVPNSLQLDPNGSLWVLCGGNPSFTGNETAGSLVAIDTADNMIANTFDFGVTEHPSYLSIQDQTLYYYLAGEVYQFNVNDVGLPSTPVITGLSFYDMTVNNNALYGVDAKDFSSNGSLEVYDLSDNSLTESVEVSIIPGGVYFNGNFEF